MNKQALLAVTVLAVLMPRAHANPTPRRAVITGGGGNGRCTIEVTVDGAAEIEISGDMGALRTLSGRPAIWRRFECNAPLPPNPVDFHFVRIHGSGSVRLLGDPRGTGGRAVIHINDPSRGPGGYTLGLQWRGLGGGGWGPGPVHPPGHGPGPGGFPIARAIQICQDAVANRLNRDGYQYVTFERTTPDNNPGRNDWVIGTVSGKRRFESARFSFSCSVDFGSGRTRSVDIRPR